MSNINTDFLIVGAGPAGASLACFLAAHGLTGIMIAAAPSTADTPRAHITNMAALECLRDIGLEEECLNQASASENMEHTRWCYSLAGEEYARVYAWGHDPARRADYEAASPCNHVDLTQTLLEPILVNRAKDKGWDVRFSTTFLSYNQAGPNQIASEVKDNISGKTYTISSKYLFGCDGARSQVMRQLNIPLIRKPKGGLAINVEVEADLSHLMKSRVGNLHWVIQPDREHPIYAWFGLVRMVQPWTKWIFGALPKPEFDAAIHGEPTLDEWREEVRKMIGDDSIPFEVTNVSKWTVNETVAERYAEGNIFCLGDAVHRHPPANGLGSNTCIQDSYNLAWKVSLVHRNLAPPSFLETYTLERQPVGQSIITRANQGFRDHANIWNVLGITAPTLETGTSQFAELVAATPAGRQRRQDLQTAVTNSAHEFHALGQEMNQQYTSPAIYTADQGPPPSPPADPILTHQISTYPGARLPHAWLNTRIPAQRISTIDLAGHNAFTLFTGIGGDAWTSAARTLTRELGVQINAYSIGWRQDWEDVYFDWARRREVAEDGCVLVRPDRFVCWRAMDMQRAESSEGGCVGLLRHVMRCVLGFEEAPVPEAVGSGGVIFVETAVEVESD